MKISHLSALGWSEVYHLSEAHIHKPEKPDDMAYTSPSTAENHTEVAKVVAKPATTPEPKIAKISPPSSGVACLPTKANLLNMMVDKQTNITKKAVHTPDITLRE